MLHMDFFSNQVEHLLARAGWTADRAVDVESIREYVLVKGYDWFPAVNNFLEKFMDLEAKFPREDGQSDLFHFNVMKAEQGIHEDWIQKDYKMRIGGMEVCIIGQAFSNHLSLFMDISGKMYGGYDDELFFVGQDQYEAITNICLNRKFQEI